jgi:hypothetical protein
MGMAVVGRFTNESTCCPGQQHEWHRTMGRRYFGWNELAISKLKTPYLQGRVGIISVIEGNRTPAYWLAKLHSILQ